MNDPLPVEAAYAQWAAVYDDDVNATRDLDAVTLRATDLPLDGATVVEFGAGTGKNTGYLVSRARSVLALDLSPAMLAQARRRVPDPRVTFIQHDVREPWPVDDAGADIVVGNLVLEHVADLAPVFAAAHRALRPGGLLVVSELHPYRQWRGSGARFQTPDGERRVEVYMHAVSDYVNAALAAGFSLRRMAEVADAVPPGAPADLPRLLQLVLAAEPRPATSARAG